MFRTNCHDEVVADGHHHGWWRSGGALTALCVDVVRRVHHTHMVTTRWWRGWPLRLSDEQGDGSAMDLMHHTTSSFIPSTYAICAERTRGKSSRQKTVAENRHSWNRVMDPYWIRFPFPGRRR